MSLESQPGIETLLSPDAVVACFENQGNFIVASLADEAGNIETGWNIIHVLHDGVTAEDITLLAVHSGPTGRGIRRKEVTLAELQRANTPETVSFQTMPEPERGPVDEGETEERNAVDPQAETPTTRRPGDEFPE